MTDSILVTGGAGYIGSHVCKELSSQGYTPIVFDNLSKGYRDAVKWGPLEQGDLLDTQLLRKVLSKYKPVAVMHFAASIEVGESVEAPEKYYRNNVCGTLSLVTAMIEEGCDKIVFSSTAATYGEPEMDKIDELHQQKPINPYGSSKLMVEKIILDCGVAHELKHVFLRYFNAAGADSEGQIGESHVPESHLVPIVMQAASGQRETLKIFGNDYDTKDGTCIRDYIHVEDLAAAHLLALKHLENNKPPTAFNLGTGHGYSVSEVIETAKEVVGHDIPTIVEERRAGDPAILVADPSKAEKELLWKCTKTLEDIVASAWAWHITPKY